MGRKQNIPSTFLHSLPPFFANLFKKSYLIKNFDLSYVMESWVKFKNKFGKLSETLKITTLRRVRFKKRMKNYIDR